MVDIIDDLVKTVVKIAADQIASILRTISAIQTNLGRNHRHRMLGTNAVVINNARLGIQARGNINGYAQSAHSLTVGIQIGERRTQISVETGTKNGIDNNIGLIDQNLRVRHARGRRKRAHRGRQYDEQHDVPEQQNLIRLNRRNDIHIHTLMAQDIGGIQPSPPLLPKPTRTRTRSGLSFKTSLAANSPASFISSAFEVPFAFDDILETNDFFGTQNRFHLCS